LLRRGGFITFVSLAELPVPKGDGHDAEI
jgi:hypothetical protein